MLGLMDDEWPIADYESDGTLFDLTLSNQMLLFDVLSTSYTIEEEGTYDVYIPVTVSVNSEDYPFRIDVIGASVIPDTTCNAWVEPTDVDIYATIDVSVDPSTSELIVELSSYEYTWFGVEDSDVEMDDCYFESIDWVADLFGGDMTGFYDDLLASEIDYHVETSGALIDFLVEEECTP